MAAQTTKAKVAKADTKIYADAEGAPRPGRQAKHVDDVVSRVGEKLSGLRRAKGLSLQQLAAIADVSAAAIHKIERSGMVPTITTLLKLGKALGMPVGYFVQEDESPPEPVQLTREGERREVYTPHKGLELAGITGSYRQFQAAAAIARLVPGANSGSKLLSHGGEELVHVLSGEVVFRIGERDFHLKPGDSLHYSGLVPHHWENASKKPAELIWMVLRNG